MKTEKQSIFELKLGLIFIALFLSICMVIGSCTHTQHSEAEANYRQAIQAARNSEGTDIAIEEALSRHGFDRGAMDNSPFTEKEKEGALARVQKNAARFP